MRNFLITRLMLLFRSNGLKPIVTINCCQTKVFSFVVKSFLILFLLSFSFSTTSAQICYSLQNNDPVISGFQQKVNGSDFTYHSSIPNINKAMIVRAVNGRQSAEWLTEPVSEKIKSDYVCFIWLAGIGNSPGVAGMDILINDKKKFTFFTGSEKIWSYKNDDGSELYFKTDMTDGNGDDFGFMMLRVPKQQLSEGKPLTIKVIGSNSGKQSWFMVFQNPLTPGMSIKPSPAVLKGADGIRKQTLAAEIFYLGDSTTGTITANGKRLKRIKLHFGYNYTGLTWPVVKKNEKVTIRVKAGEFEDAKSVIISPVRKWRVNFVQHTHTDIGYTRPQTEILAEHLRYIDYALDYCDITDTYSPSEQFKWTCEAAWAVDEYLRSRPEDQIRRLKRRIKEGSIEVTGMYFNFDELPDEQSLAASLEPFKRFKENGIEVTTAMQDDVNGIGWCFNDYFNDLGVKYLNMGTHGHRALIPFNMPTAFWWESPSGKRMLAFRAEHYMFGNGMGIHTDDFEQFENKLLHYLISLDNKGYPYDIVAIQHSGYSTDNAPPSTLSSEMIRKWNMKYEWPKLKTAIVREFFEEIEKKYAQDLPVYRGAWPDWWTDGFASGAREVAASRQAHTDIISYTGALSLASLMGSKMPDDITGRIDEANKALLFYDEHTFGYSESVRDPYGESSMEQRALKESYAWESFRRAKMIGEEAMGLLQSHVKRETVPILAVFNTLGWSRSGVVRVYIDHQVLPPDKPFTIIDKATGLSMPAQALKHRSDGTYWGIWVENVPAFGYKKYLIQSGDQKGNDQKDEITWQNNTFENVWYRLKLDTNHGIVTSLFDKELGRELLDPDSKWKLGAFILEKLGNRSQMESFRLDDYERFGLDTVWFDSYTKGDIWNTLRFLGESKTAYAPEGFEFEIRLFHTGKRIDFAYGLRKKPITDPEGIYISFPFELNDGKIFCEVQGGVMEAGTDQIPGSANDWNTVQNFAAVRNSNTQLIIGSPDIPLMQFGAINTGRYKAGAKPESTKIYSWPMNNYWTTNFNADQRGHFKWSYYFTSGSDISNSYATHFGWGARVPFPARVLPAGRPEGNEAVSPVLTGIPENILVVQSRPVENKNEVVMQIRELDGKATTFIIKNSIRALTIRKSDVLGNAIGDDLYNGVEIKPYESLFLNISW